MLDTAKRTGMFDPLWLAAYGSSAAIWGATAAAAYGACAIRYPNRIAIADDYGLLTYRQVDWRTTRVAGGLRATGLNRGDSLGILCRNHRGFVEANLAATKLGARVVLLNTGLPGAQLAEVIEREGISTVVADADLAERVEVVTSEVVTSEVVTSEVVTSEVVTSEVVTSEVLTIVARPEEDDGWSFPELPRWRPLIQLPRPGQRVDPVLLTSGTTGAPKGANRSASFEAAVVAFGFLEKIPFSRGDTTVLPAPLFHAWGFSQMLLAATLASTIVLRRNFDPTQVLDDVEAHGATVLAAVPVMLHRLLEVDEDQHDVSSLEVVATSGSALRGTLATEWMDRFGDTLYNVYGSTEVGQVSVAAPTDMREAPGTAGKPLRGIRVQVVDEQDDEVDHGEHGNIVIESAMHFDGYTDGQLKPVVDGFMATGDRGYVDADGRLFVDGRADDMIISGGENVFPVNIERDLLAHPAVHDVAVVGVADADLGHKVRAVVVPSDDHGTAVTRSLKVHLKTSLASYEIPREFVYVSELPRNAAGKILKRELLGKRGNVPNRLVKPRS